MAVAKSPVQRLLDFARERGWRHLKLLSTAGNSYDADYFGDTSKFSKAMRSQHHVPDGKDWDETIFNVFRKNNLIDPFHASRRNNGVELVQSVLRNRVFQPISNSI